MGTPGPLGLGTPVGSGSFAALHLLRLWFCLTRMPFANIETRRQRDWNESEKLRAGAKKKQPRLTQNRGPGGDFDLPRRTLSIDNPFRPAPPPMR